MNKQKIQRQTRIRKKIRAVSDRPRLSIFRSNKYFYAQIIDDKSGRTLLGATAKTIEKKGTPSEQARELGKKLAELAKGKNVTQIVFDKGRYTYHGRVKAFAEGAREGGLQF